MISFDTDDLVESERASAFALLIQSLYECIPSGDPDEFAVHATGYNVADFVFSVVTFSPASFRRDERHLRGVGSDFLVLEAQLTGEQRLMMDGGPVLLLPQHIHLRDWACGFESDATGMSLLSIVIPRSRLLSASVLGEGNPVVIWSMEAPEGRTLALLWRELLVNFERVTLAEAETLTHAFVGFMDGLLGRQHRKDSPVTLAAMQRYLMVRLRSEVGVADLCRHFHVSRSKVYRLFEPVGGVLQFVNAARLERCRVELRHGDPELTEVGQVAASWGFSDPSSFSRRFRTRFGVAPSAVLGEARSVQSVKRTPTGSSRSRSSTRWYREYMAWFNQASGWEP
jgi:AraC-like DNA-binding protein